MFRFKSDRLADIPLAAAAFDLDGTLVDSMEFYCDAWRMALEEQGVTVDREEIYEREGEPGWVSAAVILERELKRPVPENTARDVVNRRDDFFLRMPTTKFFEGTRELLEDLRARNIPLALVTGGTRVAERFESSPWFLPLFSAVITGDLTPRGKPFPDPFLLAAERLNVPLASLLVIENAPLGIRSAVSAGAHCVAVLEKSPLKPDELLGAGASSVFAAINDLRARFEFAP